MGRRNIYVAPGRAALFDEAALMAGSLSSAIDSALELYVRQVRAGWLRCDPAERVVGRGEQRVHHTFRSRFVDEVPLGEGDDRCIAGRRHGVEVHQGVSGRLLAWHWSDPDWSRRSVATSPALDVFGGEAMPDDWFERWGIEIAVLDTAEELFEWLGRIAPEDRAAVERSLVPRVVAHIDL